MDKKLDLGAFSAFAENLSKNLSSNMSSEEKPSWWQTYSYPEASYVDCGVVLNYTFTALFFQALKNNFTIFCSDKEGKFVGNAEALVRTLTSNGAKLIVNTPCSANSKHEMFFCFDNGGIYLYFQNLKDAKFSYELVASGPESYEKYNKILSGFLADKDKNQLYVLGIDHGEPHFVEISSFPVPLNKENYSSNVVELYNYTLKQFNSDHPSGKLLILNGLPGTGKSYVIRSLMCDLKDATFLLVPPDMLDSLIKPDFIEAILNASKNKFSKGPLYLIVEDADQALLPRGTDNMAVISTLLNLTDGLLGDALNIRIIASTNANKLEIEQAMLRPGRLCKLIKFDKLNVAQANDILKNLNSSTSKVFDKDVVLADIYSAAHEDK